MSTQVEFTGTATLTPKQIAQAFCSLDADQQADFFQHVHDEARTWTGGYGQMQWLAVRKSLDRRQMHEAIGVVRDLAFPWTLFSLWGDDFLERRFAPNGAR